MSITDSSDRSQPEIRLAQGVSREFLLHHGVCPKALTPDGQLIVLTAPSAQVDALKELAFVYDRQVTACEAAQHEVEQLIERLSTSADRDLQLSAVAEPSDDLTADTRELATQPPVVR